MLPKAMAWVDTGVTEILRAIAFGNSIWVAVGDNGTVLTSSNLTTWTLRTSGVPVKNLNGVIYTGSVWIAVGHDGTIITSSDAISWTSQTSNTTEHLYGIGFNGSTMVVVAGGNSKIITSTAAGSTWTNRTNFADSNLFGVAWNNGQWLIVGGFGNLLTSTNGTGWMKQAPDNQGPLYAAAHGEVVSRSESCWFAVGGTTNGTLQVSCNAGVLWDVGFNSQGDGWSGQALRGIASIPGTEYRVIVGLNSLFCVPNYAGFWGGKGTYTTLAIGISVDLYAATYADSKWVTCGSGGIVGHDTEYIQPTNKAEPIIGSTKAVLSWEWQA